jgi:hypothetical protein
MEKSTSDFIWHVTVKTQNSKTVYNFLQAVYIGYIKKHKWISFVDLAFFLKISYVYVNIHKSERFWNAEVFRSQPFLIRDTQLVLLFTYYWIANLNIFKTVSEVLNQYVTELGFEQMSICRQTTQRPLWVLGILSFGGSSPHSFKYV